MTTFDGTSYGLKPRILPTNIIKFENNPIPNGGISMTFRNIHPILFVLAGEINAMDLTAQDGAAIHGSNECIRVSG